jgi:hypothetical protein
MGDKSPGGGLRPGSETFGLPQLSFDERTANAEANSELTRTAIAEATNSSVVVKVSFSSRYFPTWNLLFTNMLW